MQDWKKDEIIFLKRKEKKFCVGNFEIAVTCDRKLNKSQPGNKQDLKHPT